MFRLSFDPAISEAAVVSLINDARKTIDVSLYGFENDAVANALITAYQRRGIQVRMSTEYDSEPLKSYQQVILAGIPVKLGNTSAIQHNKYFIVDKKYVVTGSTNFTAGMLVHYNNLTIMKSEGLAAEFQKDFDVQWNGAYSGDKDAKYITLYGSTPWPETEYQLGDLKVNAYFTPYQNTFAGYRARMAGDPDCTATCIDPTSGTTLDNTCATGCNVSYCYDAANTRTIYRYFNYDKNVFQCRVNSSNSYNNYRSALNIVIQLLRNAKKSITLLVFAFTDRVIMNELKNAKERGLDVRVYMDYNQYRSQYRNSGASFIDLRQKVGFVKLVRKWNSGLLHHKVIYTDDENLILGSMNYSAAAVTDNDENFLLIKNAGSMIGEFRKEAARIDEQSFLLPPTEDDGYYIPNTDNGD